MNGQDHIDLATLVGVYIDLSLEEHVTLLRVPTPPPEELLAFYMFRRDWRVGSVLCHFTATDGSN